MVFSRKRCRVTLVLSRFELFSLEKCNALIACFALRALLVRGLEMVLCALDVSVNIPRHCNKKARDVHFSMFIWMFF